MVGGGYKVITSTRAVVLCVCTNEKRREIIARHEALRGDRLPATMACTEKRNINYS